MEFINVAIFHLCGKGVYTNVLIVYILTIYLHSLDSKDVNYYTFTWKNWAKQVRVYGSQFWNWLVIGPGPGPWAELLPKQLDGFQSSVFRWTWANCYKPIGLKGSQRKKMMLRTLIFYFYKEKKTRTVLPHCQRTHMGRTICPFTPLPKDPNWAKMYGP